MSFVLVGFSLFAFYWAFLLHDALYPGSGRVVESALVVFLAYMGFVALHEAQHLRQRGKGSNSHDAME